MATDASGLGRSAPDSELERLRQRCAELERRLTERVPDDTERLRRELDERNQELSTILEHAPFTVVVLERDSRIRYINRVAPGYRREDVVGGYGRNFVPPDQVAFYDEALEALFERREPVHFELPGLLGQLFDVHMLPVEYDGVVDHALSFSVDIADHRQASSRQREVEQQLQQAQKLESLGVLAGGIAHDFNNLLVGVLGNAELALRTVPLGHTARKPLEGIVESGRRAADLCRQMLAYSGKGRFVVQRVQLSELVREMTELLQASISKRARLVLDLDTTLPVVEVDVTQLRQVVMNLLTNASDAVSTAGGTITITTRANILGAEAVPTGVAGKPLPPGVYLRLEVSDTGHGMDEATRARMFDPFFSNKGAGRGLGLAAVQGIVWGHRGAISVHSEAGVGTSVRVLLPACDGAAEPRRDTGRVPPVTRRGAGTVLVVDDEPAVRAVSSMSLREAGYDVLEASDGSEAVATYRARPGQVVAVLLDMTMPGMDGAATYAALEELDPDVRVVLTSGFDEGERVAALGGRERVVFLPKPARLHQLVQAVAAVARARQAG
jgi:two-component system cell cycle sensor histidine kinase/response regulator CckA